MRRSLLRVSLVPFLAIGCDLGASSEPAPAPPTVVAPAAITPLRLPPPLFVARDPVDRPSGIAVSADGSTVAFSSGGRVTPDDSDADDDVFVYVPATRAITRLSIGGDGPAYLEPHGVSADGQRVLFTFSGPLAPDDRNEQIDVYLADRRDRSVTRVSLGPDGRELDGVSYMAAISGDGRVVAFTTHAERVVPSDHDDVRDVYVRDLATGAVERASVGPSGRGPSDQTSGPLGMSGDGARVVFFATGLVPHDPPADSFSGELDWFERGAASAQFGVDLRSLHVAGVASDGRTLVATRSEDDTTVGLRVDLATGRETRIPGARALEMIAISPDAHVIAFVAWEGDVRALSVLRDDAPPSSRPLDPDLASGRDTWRSFSVANDGTVVADLVVRDWQDDAWTFQRCVAILAPTPVALACSAPADHEDF